MKALLSCVWLPWMKKSNNRPSELFALLLLLALPAVAEAQFTYTTNSGAITITGYSGPGGAVTIPSETNGLPVTSIGDEAFEGSSLTSVTIPNSVTYIGVAAFEGCSLGSITIPSSVTTINSLAFGYDAGLTSVYLLGNEPSFAGGLPFYQAHPTAYYLPGTTGWGTTLDIASGAPLYRIYTALIALPAITLQPQSQTISAGENATFTVAANSVAPLSYQWLLNGAPVSGALGSSYTIIQPPQGGSYSVVVSNFAGSVTSAAAVLTVLGPQAPTVTIASGLTANDKIYDGTTSATLSSNNVVLAGVLAADAGNVALSTNGYTAAFAGAAPGIGQGVTVSGLSLTGSAAANYLLLQPGLTANITPAPVTITSGLTANSKLYDGTTSATLSSNSVVLAGVVAADAGNVALSTNGYTAAFASAAPGASQSVTVSGLSLTGSAAADYSLTQPILTASIAAPAAPFTYTTDNGAITLTGYLGRGGAVAIPGEINGLPVTSIGDSAFYGCTSLASVTIPNSVTYLGAAAFENCSSLASVTIGNNVTNIGDEAFTDCYSLGSVTIGNSVTYIGVAAFEGCSLGSITIPSSVTTIVGLAFGYDDGLTNVYFLGNEPSFAGELPFYQAHPTAYYLPGTTGWGTTLDIGSGSPLYAIYTAPIAVPAITLQPQSQTVSAGENATFTVAATSVAPLSYQWLLNGAPVSGTLGSSYTIIQPPQSGSYSVVVTNFAGSVTSAAAVLTVLGPQAPTVTIASGLTAISKTYDGTTSATPEFQQRGAGRCAGRRRGQRRALDQRLHRRLCQPRGRPGPGRDRERAEPDRQRRRQLLAPPTRSDGQHHARTGDDHVGSDGE